MTSSILNSRKYLLSLGSRVFQNNKTCCSKGNLSCFSLHDRFYSTSNLPSFHQFVSQKLASQKKTVVPESGVIAEKPGIQHISSDPDSGQEPKEIDASILHGAQKTKFLRECIWDWKHPISPTKEVQQLGDLLQLPLKTVRSTLAKGMFEKRTSTTKPVTAEQKQIIRLWMEQHGWTRPNNTERLQLKKQTGLNGSQLSKQISHLLDPSSDISYEAKVIIGDWCKNNPERKPTEEEKDLLQQQTGLGRTQLLHQISYMRDKKGTITLEKKMMLKQWLEEHNRTTFTAKDLEDLSKKTDLGRKQVRNILEDFVYKRKQVKIQPEQQAMLKRWLKEHNFQTPSPHQRRDLLKTTGWTSRQLSDQIRSIIRRHHSIDLDEHRNIPQAAKDIILGWLLEHDFRAPTVSERDVLQSQSGLSRVQLNDQISYLRSNRGNLTFESKHRIIHQVREWKEAAQQDSIADIMNKLTMEQWRELSEMGQISVKQVRELIKRNEAIL